MLPSRTSRHRRPSVVLVLALLPLLARYAGASAAVVRQKASSGGSMVCTTQAELGRTEVALNSKIAASGLGQEVIKCFDGKLHHAWANSAFTVQSVHDGNAVEERCFERSVIAAAIGGGFAQCLPAMEENGDQQPPAPSPDGGTDDASGGDGGSDGGGGEGEKNDGGDANESAGAGNSTEQSSPAPSASRLLLSQGKAIGDHERCSSGKHLCCVVHVAWVPEAMGVCFKERCGCDKCGWCKNAPKQN